MSGPVWYGGFAAAAGLLALGGALKVARPTDTANALRALGVPGPVARPLVRLGAAVELAIGITALVVGGRVTAGLVGASYLGFALFVGAALWRHTPIASCGCFGEVDAPPTVLHAVVNVAAAIAAGAGVASGHVPALDAVLRDQPWGGVPLLLFIVLAGYLAFLVMAVLPRTMARAKALR